MLEQETNVIIANVAGGFFYIFSNQMFATVSKQFLPIPVEAQFCLLWKLLHFVNKTGNHFDWEIKFKSQHIFHDDIC